jgi:hypothetical protein
MRRPRARQSVGLGLMGALLLGVSDAPAWERQARAVCEPLGVPWRLVRAVIAVESMGNPYVIHARIGETWRVYRPPNRAVAEVVLRELLRHTTWIDVGLMQIHVRLWASELGVTPLALLDPLTNMWAGCTILSRALQGEGPLWQRIGRYHSHTPARHQAYTMKVLRYATADLDARVQISGGERAHAP